MRKILFTAIMVCAIACSQKITPSNTYISANPFSLAGKSVAVYTTADSSNFRLSLTDNVQFRDLAQPNEGQVSVFVDPTKTFQTFMGIGGAITDASAETFAQLSKSKQQAFLEAYYDVNKGIGYTLARTTIHSSDFSSGSYTYVTDGDPIT